MSVFNILVTYWPAFLKGLFVTLQLCAIIWTGGLVLGATLGMAGTRLPAAIGGPSRIISFILGATPLLVFLFWMHYSLQGMLGIVIDPFWTTSFILTVLNIFGVADIVRTALADFPRQYLVAAQVTGLTRRQTIFRIQLPLILRSTLPSLLLLQVAMLHATLFSSLISVEEIFRMAQRINSQIYKPVEIYTAMGVFFLALCLPVNGLAWILRQRYTRNISEH
ncbi:MAG: ABC transporter permease subunit [Pseudomonadota bacterium]|nr:ABC transporter permease subunit [Pseudomonadota bacterium]